MRLTIALLCTLTLSIVGQPTPSRYTVTDLGTLGGAQSIAYGINATGQVVGSSHITSAIYSPHAFLWQNGTMIDIGTLDGGYSNARAINEAGQIVGDSTTAD